MTFFYHKQIFARRRLFIYAVLCIACFLIKYGLIFNFMQAESSKLQDGDNYVRFSWKREKDIRDSFDSPANNKRQKNELFGDISISYTYTAATSDITVGQTSMANFDMDSNNQSINLERLTAKIAFDILESIDYTSINATGNNNQTCSTIEIIGNSCQIGSCLQLQLPKDLRARVAQLVAPPHLQINDNLRQLLSHMADKVPGYYDFILVSGVSYSHFEEAQAMLYNVHTNLFPYLKNFTFIYYNLGLSEEQRNFMAKICRCHLIDFPFELFPEFVSFLKCYSWKPLIINAHISRTNILYWIDASVRFTNQSIEIMNLISKARVRGIQTFKVKPPISRVTLPTMFHFFGDEACIYSNYTVVISGSVLFHNTLFVNRAILEPWAACAINTTCMCPKNENAAKIRRSCHNECGTYQYGICHRFDQSAISIILAKIYQDKIENIFGSMKTYLSIERADKMEYPVQNITDDNN